MVIQGKKSKLQDREATVEDTGADEADGKAGC